MIEELLDSLVFQAGPRLWTSTLGLVLFGRSWTVQLSVEGQRGAPPTPPSAQQRATLTEFLRAQRPVGEAVERQVFEYYRTVSSEYRRAYDSATAERLVPSISAPSEMSRLVTPTEVYVPASPEGRPHLLLILFNCSWDDSHGIGAKVVDMDVKEVAEQQALL